MAKRAREMAETEARLITSRRTQSAVIDRHHFIIEIYRYENQENWTLEVVDPDGTSHLWEQRFSEDEIALETAFREIGTAGAEAFMRRDNVIPFRKPQRL